MYKSDQWQLHSLKISQGGCEISRVSTNVVFNLCPWIFQASYWSGFDLISASHITNLHICTQKLTLNYVKSLKIIAMEKCQNN
jgi:hypothetical protein